MPSCSSTSGTRSAKSSSKAAAHEERPIRWYSGLAGGDLHHGAFDLAMGIRPACKSSLAGARLARSLFCVETVRDLRTLPHSKLYQIEDGRLQRLDGRRLRQMPGAKRKQS